MSDAETRYAVHLPIATPFEKRLIFEKSCSSGASKNAVIFLSSKMYLVYVVLQSINVKSFILLSTVTICFCYNIFKILKAIF